MSEITLQSTITCPVCGHSEIETMPVDSCLYFYECQGCGALLSPKSGDCCVFCSYGTVPCPPKQKIARSSEHPCCKAENNRADS
ncbi:GDCCVxC domain-containing (seleno)protein [Acidithiobacillus sp. AC3]|nr:GDCCVxC domain-containing (seleno)protein [Igneacidithiobacillus copahuensis]